MPADAHAVEDKTGGQDPPSQVGEDGDEGGEDLRRAAGDETAGEVVQQIQNQGQTAVKGSEALGRDLRRLQQLPGLPLSFSAVGYIEHK